MADHEPRGVAVAENQRRDRGHDDRPATQVARHDPRQPQDRRPRGKDEDEWRPDVAWVDLTEVPREQEQDWRGGQQKRMERHIPEGVALDELRAESHRQMILTRFGRRSAACEWLRRYRAEGEPGLPDRRSRPCCSPPALPALFRAGP